MGIFSFLKRNKGKNLEVESNEKSDGLKNDATEVESNGKSKNLTNNDSVDKNKAYVDNYNPITATDKEKAFHEFLLKNDMLSINILRARVPSIRERNDSIAWQTLSNGLEEIYANQKKLADEFEKHKKEGLTEIQYDAYIGIFEEQYERMKRNVDDITRIKKRAENPFFDSDCIDNISAINNLESSLEYAMLVLDQYEEQKAKNEKFNSQIEEQSEKNKAGKTDYQKVAEKNIKEMYKTHQAIKESTKVKSDPNKER
jgi:hypothetical protein